MSQMKEQDKTAARDQRKMDINNMPDRGFKAMVIKILTGFQERVGDLSETLDKETENKKRNNHKCLKK